MFIQYNHYFHAVFYYPLDNKALLYIVIYIRFTYFNINLNKKIFSSKIYDQLFLKSLNHISEGLLRNT
jgi:hypothetical protein